MQRQGLMDRIEELEESMDSAKASTPTLSTVAFLDGRSFSVGRSEGGASSTIHKECCSFLQVNSPL